ncbi:hypothetical protein F5Y17DRAFT_422574 [Xylariaceae sp. FL0594]|nr:hypothetical protein F5Y17DRAFT_422574 [Xylariaceae sp. FL0594]
MQALWTRAARAQSSCRCRICQHSTNAVVRRTGASAPKRKVHYGDVFTACYTTIIGTAALIDAGWKSSKRKELESQLERARNSLRDLSTAEALGSLDSHDVVRDGDTDADSPATCAEHEQETDPNIDVALGPGFQPAFPSHLSLMSNSAVAHIRGTKAVQPLVQELRKLCNLRCGPLVARSTLQSQIDWAAIETAIALEESDHESIALEPTRTVDIDRETNAILHMIDRLLNAVSEGQSVRPQDMNSTMECADYSSLTDLLATQQYPSYDSPSTSPGYTAHVRAQLNESIRRIFNNAPSSLEIVCRICYNLLTIGVPPSVHTYNILIAGFNRIGRSDLAEVVVNTYVHRTRHPATDQTVVCLLNHYRTPGGRIGLRRVIDAMRGRFEGLHYAVVAENLIHANSWKQAWREENPDRSKFFKTRRIDLTYDHLVKGWLYHRDVGLAMMTFVACFREGATIPVQTLQELFRGCLMTADFCSARKLAAGIGKHVDQFKRYLAWVIRESTAATTREVLQSLYQILNICWMPFAELFGVTWKESKKAAVAIREIVSRMDMQLEMQQAARLPSLVFDTLTSDQPLSIRLDLALAHLDAAERRRSTAIPKSNYLRLAMILSLERRLIDLEERGDCLVAAYNSTMISLRADDEFDLDRAGYLLSQNKNTMIWHNYRHALSRALCRIDMGKPLRNRREIARALAMALPDDKVRAALRATDGWRHLHMSVLVSLFGDNKPETVSRQGVHGELEDRLQAVEDSIRALLFSRLHHLTQKEIAFRYWTNGYFSTPIWALRRHLVRDLTLRMDPYRVIATKHDYGLVDRKAHTQTHAQEQNQRPEQAQVYESESDRFLTGIGYQLSRAAFG